MAKNLNYDVSGNDSDVCYGNDAGNCTKYGRLYDWATAMALPNCGYGNSCASQISANHRGICPSGWHIPSNAEWDALYRFIDGTNGTSSPCYSPTAGRYLKATSGWNNNGNGEDKFGFSALPGGYGSSDGFFDDVGYVGTWWSATEDYSNYAYYRHMGYDDEDARWDYDIKGALFSVRCLQDSSSYTVTYNAGTGGTGVAVPAYQTKINDVALTLSTAVPVRTDYAFAGWNTAADGKGTSYAPGANYTTNASLTLYAQWKQTSIINGTSVIYGGETYESVVIYGQTWFKRNLNYNANGSKCFDNDPANCATYGRLYDWATAMALPGSCNSNSCASQVGTKHQGICPTGWHLPSYAEWRALMQFVNPDSDCSGYSSCAVGKLKATNGWNSYSGVPAGTDDYGFSALPGGYGYSDGSFYLVGYRGYWWSASEYSASYADSWHMYYNSEYASWVGSSKDCLYSVRCLKD
jgi:uncharacterized protein (TIGR02145 family)/uncharacterized repeat protein (TIGR02543 family)